MKKDPSFHDYIVYDVLGSLPDLSSRHMMSGWSIYSNGVTFAAIIGNQFYLKTKSAQLIERLQELGSEKFSYEKSDGKVVSMSYWYISEDNLENHQMIHELVEEAIIENTKTTKKHLKDL